MAIRIKNLTCRVRVKVVDTKPRVHKDPKPIRPGMVFALAKPLTTNDSTPEPSQMATEERGAAAAGKPQLTMESIDPKQVADRVYELMQREVQLARARGVTRRKG